MNKDQIEGTAKSECQSQDCPTASPVDLFRRPGRGCKRTRRKEMRSAARVQGRHGPDAALADGALVMWACIRDNGCRNSVETPAAGY